MAPRVSGGGSSPARRLRCGAIAAALALLMLAAVAIPADAKSPAPSAPKLWAGSQPLSVDLAVAQEIFPNASVTGTVGAQAPRYFKVFANRSLASPETLAITLEATGSLFGSGSLSVFDPEQVLLDEVFTRNPGDINVSLFLVPETGYYLIQLVSDATFDWAVTANWTAGADAFVDNDNDHANASVLSFPSGSLFGNLTEVTDLGDLFVIDLTAAPPSGDALLINLTSGFADLDVYIYHLEGGLAVIDGLSISPFGTEFAAAFANSSKTYYVRVMSYAGTSTYALAWSVLRVVADDNDVPSKATTAPSGFSLNNLSRWDTRDLFAFILPANSTVNVSFHTFGFNATRWAPDLQAVFWDETFARVSWSFAFDPEERINVQVPQAGLYYLDVFIADSSYYLTTNLSFDYSMTVSVDTPPALFDPQWNETLPEDTTAVWDLRALIPGDFPGEAIGFTVQVASGQVTASMAADGRTLTVVPEADWAGAAAVRVTAQDRWRTESIDLPFSFLAVNDPPRLAASSQNLSFDEDTTGALLLASSIFDPEGDVWSERSVAGSSALTLSVVAGTLRISAPPDASGVFSVTIAVEDAQGAAANLSVAIVVRPVNDAPRFGSGLGGFQILEDATSAEATFDLAGRAVDPDGDAIVYGLVVPANLAWLVLGSNLTLYPARDFSGNLSVQLAASDGTLQSFVQTFVEVAAVDDAPVVRVGPGQLVGRENHTFTYSAEADDIDTPGFSLTYSFALDGGAAGPLQTDRLFSYTFSFEDAGYHVLRVTVSDGTYSDSADLTVFVSETNRAPAAEILAPAGASFPRGAVVTFSARAIDPDGTAVNITWIVDGTQASSLPSFSMEGLSPGTHTVQLRVSDGDLVTTASSSFEVQGGLPGIGFEAALISLAVAALAALSRRRR